MRVALAEKLRTRAAQPMAAQEPTDAELDAWLASHRSKYETPLRYDFEVVTFPRSDPAARSSGRRIDRRWPTMRTEDARSSDRGWQPHPRFTRRQVRTGGLREHWQLAARDVAALETQDSLLLVRVNQRRGLPSREAIRAILTIDWAAARKKEAVDEFVKSLLCADRFKESP